MDNFNKGVPSSTSIKPNSVSNPSFKDAGGNKSNNENELNKKMPSKFKSPSKKQLPTKNFMNSTISAEIKAVVPKKKILGERNETLDTVEQPSLLRSSSFGSNSMKYPVVEADDSCLQPYDPVKNFLSPRPKFLMYNPNRRRKIINLQENDEDCVKISTCFDDGIPSSELESGVGSSDSKDSCSQKEPAEETEDVINEGEVENGEDDEEVMVEFEEDRFWSLKGFLKFLFVVIALILTTQAICSMNSPTRSQTLESVYGLNFSEVGYLPIREPDFLVGRLKEEDVYDDNETLDMIEPKEEQVEVQIDETDVIQDDILQEHEIEESEVIECDNVEAEKVLDFNQDGFVEEDDSDANVKNSQLINDDEFETANNMEDELENEIDDQIKETTDLLIRVASFDPTVAVLIGLSTLILTSFSIIYQLKRKKKKSSISVTTPTEKQEIKNLEPSTNPSSIQHEEEEPFLNSASLLVPGLQNDVSNQISHFHAPSVELLGEFVFGEEVTSNISAETKSSQMELSTGDSYTVKKQRHKNAEVVTPSPVRRSSRIKNLSVKSP